MSGQIGTEWPAAPLRRRTSAYTCGSSDPGARAHHRRAGLPRADCRGYTLRTGWALFSLIPAFGSFQQATESLRQGENNDAFGKIVAGLGFIALAAALLVRPRDRRRWPVALIGIGAGLLISRRGSGSSSG